MILISYFLADAPVADIHEAVPGGHHVVRVVEDDGNDSLTLFASLGQLAKLSGAIEEYLAEQTVPCPDCGGTGITEVAGPVVGGASYWEAEQTVEQVQCETCGGHRTISWDHSQEIARERAESEEAYRAMEAEAASHQAAEVRALGRVADDDDGLGF